MFLYPLLKYPCLSSFFSQFNHFFMDFSRPYYQECLSFFIYFGYFIRERFRNLLDLDLLFTENSVQVQNLLSRELLQVFFLLFKYIFEMSLNFLDYVFMLLNAQYSIIAIQLLQIELDMQKEIIKPYFHYHCKSEALVIDSQYTFEGEYLAVCTSNASILIYKSPIQQTLLQEQDRNPVAQYGQINKNNCFLKLAWSFYNAFVLAAMSINKQICFFEFDKSSLKLQKMIKCSSIPIFGSFMPTFEICILSVGFSNGSIALFNQNLEQIFTIECHKQSVNWLTWERRLGSSGRNLWISQYFPTHVNQQMMAKPPMMASGSSDGYIKLWNVKDKKLVLAHTFKAHDKQIRQVMWKPNYFNNSKNRNIVSCSEDGFVKFWEISETGNKILEKMKSLTNLNGPVYRAEYNLLGSLIAISYNGGEEGKVFTKVYSDKQGALGEEINIQQ